MLSYFVRKVPRHFISLLKIMLGYYGRCFKSIYLQAQSRKFMDKVIYTA
jgi:hypothetical protein